MVSDSSHNESPRHRGWIAWMTYNRITPNLLMLIFLVGGFIVALRIKQEVFPEFDLDMVTVQVAYPGSSPEEVEQGIVLVIEEAVRGLDGVKEIMATAGEGMGMVRIELEEGADDQRVYQDIRQQIDRIVTFPEDAERPDVGLIIIRREVLDMQIYGDTSEWVLRELAEQVRDRLLQDPAITQVDLDLAWPASVYSMSHVAIPAPLDDPLYGLFPAEVKGYDLHLGNIQLRGERNLLKMSEANLMRLRSNPFFDFVETKIAEWIITDLE